MSKRNKIVLKKLAQLLWTKVNGKHFKISRFSLKPTKLVE